MKDRIKIVRKKAGLKQAQFAKILGVKTNTITSYETGVRTPSDAIILSICRAFHVNETWLRTGEGDMLVEMTPDEEIASLVGDILADAGDTFRKRFVSALAKLDDRGWDVLENLVNDIADKKKKD